ncbi:unnamed protein product [Cuscuta europaea]|uniref:Alpha/beta hydrolase fold-3 domain-containing protein n=1 Tax=Cuscuta europaea TaxID=41803 RepID=A0A9P0ZLS8_CUSEU|nr:unnamed protein product [Cuscuta europaea]
MKKRRMPAMAADYSPGRRLQVINLHKKEEEIKGLIRVYEDGHVERPQIVPNVTCDLPPDSSVTSIDVTIEKCTKIWARCYVPKGDDDNNPSQMKKFPLIVYFHGGGFCVGSASWGCYHEFLAKLAGKSECVIVSVSYRLAPESQLPAAYDDGVKTIMWLRQHARTETKEEYFWLKKCDFSRTFLSGDSAGGNIAHNVSIRLCPKSEKEFKHVLLSPLEIKGTILIQPFFGGKSRTCSEICAAQPPLTLADSDAYWRLALPEGVNRDHPWCNPMVAAAKGYMKELRVPPSLVFISELDMLKDRNLEFCGTLSRGGKKMEVVVCKGVGHSFHILDKSQLAQTRTDELIDQIKAFTARS